MGLGFASWSLFFYVLLFLMCAQGSSSREIPEVQNWKDIDKEVHDLHPHAIADHLWIYAKQDDDDDGHKGLHAKHVINKGGHDSKEQAMDDHPRMFATEDDDDGRRRILTNHVHAHPSSHMDHMDPSLNVFFTINDLKVGKIMPIYFPYKDPSTSPHLLPREEAHSIPFSLTKLQYLLEFFSFSHGSSQAKAMEDTLTQCEFESIKGETKLCVTSLESMLDFALGIFGFETHFKVLATSHLTKSMHTLLQNYTILELPKEVSAPKMIACHAMPYPYAVFYCHCPESENKLFEVSLGGENGERVEAVAVCHMDTSHWDHDHVSFHVLSIKPGSSPVCHFFPADNLVWIPSPT